MDVSDTNRFSARAFSQVFDIRNGDGDPFLLIGGQAVNVWAERYVAVEPELESLAPFTSEDIDFQGNNADVKHIATQLGSVAQFPHKIEMTALAGIIPIRLGAARANIEVVRNVPGVTNELIEKSALTIDFEGKTVRVINPIALVSAKLHLATTVSQEKRHDVHHLKIMILCARGFLREVLGAIEKQDIAPAGWLAAVNTLHKLQTSSDGKRAAKNHDVNWSYLPTAEISSAKNPKIVSFREIQLPRWRGK